MNVKSTRKALHILSVNGSFPPAFKEGGPAVMVHRLSKELILLGNKVRALTTDKNGNARMEGVGSRTVWDGVPVRYCRWDPSLFPYKSAELRMALPHVLSETDVVLLSSSWTQYGVDTSKACIRAGAPYIVYTHGSYNLVRLRKGRLKKFFWWNLFDRGPL